MRAPPSGLPNSGINEVSFIHSHKSFAEEQILDLGS